MVKQPGIHLIIANTIIDLVQGDIKEHLPVARIPMGGDVIVPEQGRKIIAFFSIVLSIKGFSRASPRRRNNTNTQNNPLSGNHLEAIFSSARRIRYLSVGRGSARPPPLGNLTD